MARSKARVKVKVWVVVERHGTDRMNMVAFEGKGLRVAIRLC